MLIHKDQHTSTYNNVVWSNELEVLTPWGQSTGLKTYSHYHAHDYSNSACSTAEDFLRNSYYQRSAVELDYSIFNYLCEYGSVMTSLGGLENNSDLETIDLPANLPCQVTLKDAMMKRRSVRHYSDEECTIHQLATLLRCANGVATEECITHENTTATFHFRTTPSAGALYPIDLYVAVRNTKGISAGLYRYHVRNDHLIPLENEGIFTKLYECFGTDNAAINYQKANLIIFFTGKPWRLMRKYGARGMRHLFHEAGSIAQNIHLACVALDLGSTDYSAVYDQDINVLLKIDGRYQTFVHSIMVGTKGCNK